MRVLHVNHTAQISGGERSLLDLLAALPPTVEPLVACPEGPLAAAVRRLGVPVIAVPSIEGSLRLHVRHTTRAIVDVGRQGAAVLSAARRVSPDLVHANSLRAGHSCGVLRCLGGPPVVVHVRDCLPDTALATLCRHLVYRSASMIICNSWHTARRFGAANGRDFRTVHSPVDVTRFTSDDGGREAARVALGLDNHPFVLCVVAQITVWKGQADAIEILSRLRSRWPDIRLLLVGDAKFTSASTRYDNVAYLRALRSLVRELDLAGHIDFLGERDDVPLILQASDLLLAPSWEEPFGRSVVEGMAMGLPVIATCAGGPAEVIEDGVDGLLLPPRQPARWAAAAEALLESSRARATMGHNARTKVLSHFTSEQHAAAMLRAFHDVRT